MYAPFFYILSTQFETRQKFSQLTDTLLNQAGQYIDSNSANFGIKTPIFRQNQNTFIFSPGDVAEEILKTRVFKSLEQLKEKYGFDIIIRRKENSEYFDTCFKSYLVGSNTDKN